MPPENPRPAARTRPYDAQKPGFFRLVSRARLNQKKKVEKGQNVSFTRTLADAVGRFGRFAWRHPKLGLAYLGSSLIPGGFVFKATLPGPATRREEGYLRGAFRNAWRNPVSKVRLWWVSRRLAPPASHQAREAFQVLPKRAGLPASKNRVLRPTPPPVTSTSRPVALRTAENFRKYFGAPPAKREPRGTFADSIVMRWRAQKRQPSRPTGKSVA